jgi:transcriptional regulator with XRE-family HTH domain
MPKNGAHPTDTYVGKRVRMRRMMLHISQTKLGDALGLTFQQVQKYEKGTNRVSASRLQRISDVLQVPVTFFFEGGSPVADRRVEAADRKVEAARFRGAEARKRRAARPQAQVCGFSSSCSPVDFAPE